MFSLLHLTQNLSLAPLAALLLCFITLRPLIQLGIMDVPVQRSAHHTPTPKGGGLAIIAAFLGSMALQASLAQAPLTRAQLCLIGGVLLLCTVSWVDDMRPFPARYKLAAQSAATSLLLIGIIPSPNAIIPMIIMGLVCTNALNFMDGLNGLAAGVMFLSAVIMAGFGISPAILLLLTSSLLAFLPFNFPKARIFMGDAGSQPCALILSWGWMSTLPHHEHLSALPSLFWLFPCLMAGIFWDVTFTLGRRLCAGEPLATAHRGHLYQLAVRTGIPSSAVTLCHWGFTLWGGAAFALCHGLSCVIAVIVPQLLWTVTIVQRARTHLRERW
ncbi:MraY family glycosyltransferase [Saccharibacter floricola]|uniref:hypothetical protein n=1 Tax=Saccharibacter floricola TaxID=231053 RepID=UPI00036678AB|nr:hypothetical protein [Saccharibacter floricola]